MSSGVLSAFDLLGDSFYGVGSDGRVRVWDTRTAALRFQLTDKDHLAAVYTCLAWGNTSAPRKGKKSKQPSSSGYLAVGTDKGVIVVWDISTNEVLHRLGENGEGHSSRVNCVVFNQSATVLYSCSKDKHVVEWDLSTGSVASKFKADKHGLQRLALSPDNSTLLTASSAIKQWDLSSKEVLKKYAGHPTPVTSLSFSPDGKYFVSACDDRFVSVWDAAADGTADAKAFTLPLAPSHVELASVAAAGKSKKKKGASKVGLVACHAQSVHVWDGFTVSSTDGSSSPDAHLKAASGEVLSCKIVGDEEVLVAHGTGVKPAFERVVCVQDGTMVSEHKLTRKDGGVLLGSKGAEGKKSAAVSEEMVKVAGPAGMKMADPKAKNQGDMEQDSLAEKVAALGFPAAHRTKDGLPRIDKKDTPKADSLLALLIQALQSDDNDLLEYCLGVTDPVTIQNSVQRLPTQHVVPFLNKVVVKFQAKPSRGITLVVWIRAVLVTHSSYLMTVPDLVKHLSGLYQTMDSRLQVFKKLLKLNGRLDLVVSQIGQQAAASGVAAGTGAIYVEGADMGDEDDDSDEEDEDDLGDDMEMGEDDEDSEGDDDSEDDDDDDDDSDMEDDD